MTSLGDIERRRRLQSLVEKYTRSFPTFTPSFSPDIERENTASAAVILLSGSTGVFGANILAELVASSSIQRVYAVSRPGKDDVRERHSKTLKREGYNPETILGSPKVRLLEADLSVEGFGVEKKLFEELETSVTHIIHNAWKVNFNVPVSEFEPNFWSVRNLVDFSLRTRAGAKKPKKLVFISSIAVFQNGIPAEPNKIWPEEHLDQPDSTFHLGYAEAKWVSEQILNEAAGRTALRPTVVRLGQIVGGPGGYWSEKDWFATMVKSSVFLGSLPAIPGVFSWNKAHVAAHSLLDMLETKERYVHIVNPQPIPATDLITIFARKLRLPVVCIDDWMTALQRSIDAVLVKAPRVNGKVPHEFLQQEIQKNPAARMLVFFRRVQEGSRGKPLRPDQTTTCTPLLRCEKAVGASRTLQDRSRLEIGEEEVDRWLENWKAVGFLDTAVIKGVKLQPRL